MPLSQQALMTPTLRRHSCPCFTSLGITKTRASTEMSTARGNLKPSASDTRLNSHLWSEVVPLSADDALHAARVFTIPANSEYGTPCLRGHYYPPACGTELKAMAVIVPGTGQSARTYAAQAYQISHNQPEGIGVMVCNKMGHGESDGWRGVFHDKTQIVGNVALYLDKAYEIARSTLKHEPLSVNAPLLARGESAHASAIGEATVPEKIPLLVYGQSLGGLLVAQALQEQGDELDERWSAVHGLLHNPWLKLREHRQPAAWQQVIMNGLGQLSLDSVVCRSGSLWSTFYANFLASNHFPHEHSLIGVVALQIAERMGETLSEQAHGLSQKLTIVLSNDDELVNPDETEAAFLANTNARIFRWHNSTAADHNQNITPIGALAMTQLTKDLLLQQERTHFLLNGKTQAERSDSDSDSVSSCLQSLSSNSTNYFSASDGQEADSDETLSLEGRLQ